MIIGAHAIIYNTNADATRILRMAFRARRRRRRLFIFALPPSVAVHPSGQ
jgi:hypothetical protein